MYKKESVTAATPYFHRLYPSLTHKKVAILLPMPGNDFSATGDSQARFPIYREHQKQNDDKKKQCQTISPVRLS
ncbi:MAG: hypothetical protein LUD00_13705 [Prevotellaceae bacterium]|nr:hypothetical protein [Prevotellaceae bacterium]